MISNPLKSHPYRFIGRFTKPPLFGLAWDDPELVTACDAVNRGELAEGQRLLAATRTDPDARDLRVHKLAKAAIKHADALTTLARENPDDPDLAVWLGSMRIKMAWRIRSGRRAKYVSQDSFEKFWLALGLVAEPLERAIALLPDDPVPWDLMLWRGLGLQVGRAELNDIRAEIVTRDPFFFAGCKSWVQVLCPKWQGSTEELREFADWLATTAPAGHPARALSVVAHSELAVESRQAFTTRFRTPAVRDVLAECADTWLAASVPHVRTIEAHHLFGAAFWFGADRDRARRHLAQVSQKSLPHDSPWAMLGNGANFYREARWKLGLK